MRSLLVLFICTCLLSCQRKAAICPPDCCATFPLVHTVYFDVQPEDSEALIQACKKMEDIAEVHYLMVGAFKDLGDKRALSKYDVVMQMQFADEDAYRSYQAHPLHLSLKEKVKDLISGPPATHDFWLSN